MSIPQNRAATNRTPTASAARIKFSEIKSFVFPSGDAVAVPSLLHDPETDDSWLDEPTEDDPDDLPLEARALLDECPVNLASRILHDLLADEPLPVPESSSSCSEAAEKPKPTEAPGNDHVFKDLKW